MSARPKVDIRQALLRQAFDLPKPRPEIFQPDSRPAASDLEKYRIADDKKLCSKLVMAGIAEVVQAPGRGNWKKRPPTIVRVYPSFDAPLPTRARAAAKVAKVVRSPASSLPQDVVGELRAKWQAYYADTRAETQRRHAERVHNVDPNAIATRARAMMSESRKSGKALSSRDAVLQATDELTADYEVSLRRKYGDTIVDLLGIPNFTDVSDRERLA